MSDLTLPENSNGNTPENMRHESRGGGRNPDTRLKPTAAAVIMALAAPNFAVAQSEEIEEIIVTATRRAESIYEVPYNISAYTAKDIEDARAFGLSDLSRMVPGLFHLDQGPTVRANNNNFILRGLSAQSMLNNDGFPRLSEPSVSTYLGETPLFFPLTIKDIQRVEVLRGPQGTLYGSGSTGGTIRFIPNKPNFEGFQWDASSHVSFTDDSDEPNYGVDGIVNIPNSSNTLGLRVAAGYLKEGGFIDGKGFVALDANGVPVRAVPADVASGFVLAPEEDTNDYDNVYVRTSLLWQPTENVEALFSYHFEDGEHDDLQAANAGFAGCVCDSSLPQFPGSLFPNAAGVPGGAYPNGATAWPPNGDNEHSFLQPISYERTVHVVSLDASIDVGLATLTSATSYYDNDTTYQRVESGLYEPVLVPGGGNLAAYYGFYPRMMPIDPADTADEEGFSQEVRLASDWDRKYDFVVGGFYRDLESVWTIDHFFPGLNEFDQQVIGGFGFNPQLPDLVYTGDRIFKFEDIAVFGELTYHISDQWQITGGIRAFWQKFENDFIQTLPFCGIYCANDGLDPLGTTQIGPLEEDFQDEIFKVNTSYDINEDTMVYFTWAEGFRHGGANAIPIAGLYASLPIHVTFEPDQVTNYEIGVKGRLWDNVSYTLAGYYIEWDNFQFDDQTSGAQNGVFNGSEARSYGVELEAKGHITDNLQFNVGYGYTNAEVTESFRIQDIALATALTTPVIIDNIIVNDGDPLPGVPEHSLALGLDYVQPLKSNGWTLNYHLDGNYRSSTQSTFNQVSKFGIDFFEIDDFSIWNASVTLNANNWNVGVYARNLFNEEGITGGTPPSFAGAREAHFFITRPRTVGLTFNYRYD